MSKNVLRVLIALGLVWFCYWGWTLYDIAQGIEAYDRTAYEQTSRMSDLAEASGDPAAMEMANRAHDARIANFRSMLDDRDFARNMWVFGSAGFALVILGLWLAGRRKAAP